MRKLCGRCKEPVELEREILGGTKFPFKAVLKVLRFHRVVGCRRCGETGYRGRTGIHELMVITEEIRLLILRQSSADEIGRVAERGGWCACGTTVCGRRPGA